MGWDLLQTLARWFTVAASPESTEYDPPSPSPDAWPAFPVGAIALFLDFDGVLHRAQNGSFEFMDNLVALLSDAQDVGIVLSTSWRENASADYLLKLFPPSLRHRIHGVTPVLTDALPHLRERECRTWARQHQVHRFVAVDDEASLFSPDCPFLVATHRLRGLDRAVLAEIRARLRQLRAA